MASNRTNVGKMIIAPVIIVSIVCIIFLGRMILLRTGALSWEQDPLHTPQTTVTSTAKTEITTMVATENIITQTSTTTTVTHPPTVTETATVTRAVSEPAPALDQDGR